MIRLLTALFAASLAYLPASAAETSPPVDPDLGTNIVTAAAFDGKLWVLGSPRSKTEKGGALVTLDISDGTRALQSSSGTVDLLKVGAHLVVLSMRDDGTTALKEWKKGAFYDLPVIPLVPREAPNRLLAVGENVGVLTRHAFFILNGSDWRRIPIDDDAAPPAGTFSQDVFGPSAEVSGVPASISSLYFGTNRGEWGGSLGRIDLATRKSRSIESREITPDKRALYDAGLDPVNAIISDPANRDCVIVAVGLIHFEASGRLLRVCSDSVSLAFDKATPEKGGSGQTFYESEAFFGLVPAKDDYWAVSNAAVYRFGASGEPKRYVLSHFELWNGFYISREAPGALVFITETNRRFSVNNGTPLIVPLE